MSTFLFELPTTGAVSFADFCIDTSADKVYTAHVAQTTQARANLRGVLKETKRTDGEKDYLRIVKILDEYIPQLRSLMECIAHDQLSLQSEPTFSWRTTLSAHVFNNSPRISLPSLHADYVSSLLTYAFALSNLARAIVTALGPYEHDRAITDSDRKAKDEKINHAIIFLCRASGIFSYISDTALPEWKSGRTGGLTGVSLPIDYTQEANSALAKLSLADAQSLAIRKLLSKSAYDSNVAPGPPLPKSHPSPALTAKLHLECASFYTSARTLAKTPGSSSDSGEISVDLRRYLADEATFHSALARKWLGVDAGETMRGGDAVGFLSWAKKDLEDLKDGGKSLGLGKSEKSRALRKGKVAEEMESVSLWLKNCQKANDTVHFQPVPQRSDLQSRIPAGRLAVAAKAYLPPTPVYGPGSVEYTRRKAEDLELANSPAEPEVPSSASSVGQYAGAGSYF